MDQTLGELVELATLVAGEDAVGREGAPIQSNSVQEADLRPI